MSVVSFVQRLESTSFVIKCLLECHETIFLPLHIPFVPSNLPLRIAFAEGGDGEFPKVGGKFLFRMRFYSIYLCINNIMGDSHHYLLL